MTHCLARWAFLFWIPGDLQMSLSSSRSWKDFWARSLSGWSSHRLASLQGAPEEALRTVSISPAVCPSEGTQAHICTLEPPGHCYLSCVGERCHPVRPMINDNVGTAGNLLTC